MRVLIASGGTGGHVYPAIAIAEALVRKAGDRALDVMLVGTRTGIEQRLFEESKLPATFISARPLPARLSAKTFAAAAAIGLGFVQSWRLLRRFRPDLVIGTGGYASVCVVRTAARMGIKTLIHEMDAVPGRANRFLAQRVSAVTVGHESAKKHFTGLTVHHTGNPVRPEFASPDAAAGRAHFGLAEDRQTLLVFGGSQGAVRLNRAVLGAVQCLIRELDLQVLHVTGRGKEAEVLEGRAVLPVDVQEHYHLVAYLRGTVHLALAAADIVLSRAGAAFLAELTAVGRPAILVPYPYSMSAHQQANAEELVAAGAAVMVKDEDLEPEVVEHVVGELVRDPARLVEMAQASRAAGRTDAAERIAEVAWAIVTGERPPAIPQRRRGPGNGGEEAIRTTRMGGNGLE